MPNKLYKVQLQVNEDALKHLQKCCVAYHKTFNTALRIQEKTMECGHTYEEQLMDLNTLMEETQKETEKAKVCDKIEKGIITRAIEAAYFYFHDWWNKRMSISYRYIPPFSYMKRMNTFKTSTILKVSKGGYVYFPKFGRVKLMDNNYVPLGSYKNATVIREAAKWLIKFEATVSTEEEHDLSGELEIHIDFKGNVSFKDKFYPNVIDQENYKKTKEKQKKLYEGLKRKIKLNSYTNEEGEEVVNVTNNMKLAKQRIEKAHYRMKNIRVLYFQGIVRDILAEEPATLTFVYDPEYNERTQFTSGFFVESGTLSLIKMIRTRMDSIGTKIKYSESIKEEVYKNIKFLNTK
jgi:hypothetical protein